MEINKIIDNYNKSIQDYKLDQKSKHWKYYYGKKFNNLSEEKIINFRNNGLSDGLDNVRLLNSCEKKYNDFINYAKPLNIFSQNFEKYFPEKNIGNCPNYITRNNAFVDHDVIDSLASLLELKGLIFS